MTLQRARYLSSFLFALLIVCAGSHAQPLVQELRPVTVRIASGEELRSPFSGGLDLTRIGLFDADRDGRPDLFVFNLGEKLKLYHNDGNLLFTRQLSPFWESLPIRSWFRFADLDGDSDADLFTAGERSEIMILRNIGSNANPSFAPPDTLHQGGGEVIYSDQLTVPTFADIDNDGDLDLFSGNVDGTITWYENRGTAQSPSLIYRTSRFEGLIVISPAATEEEGGKGSTSPSALHGASVLDFLDFDGDADLDILFGDFFTRRLLYFENRGTPSAPDFDTLWVDSAFGAKGDQVYSAGFNQAVSGLLDDDADIDVIVSSLLPSAGGDPAELYENIGTVTSSQMKRRPGSVDSEIDVGRFAAPVVVRDNERRGLLVGAENGSLTWFEERDEDGQLVWQERRVYLPNGLTLTSPAAGDLDGDGKAEIVVGKGNALDGTTMRLYHFEGDDFLRIPWQLDTTFNIARTNASPALVDLDQDGDLDLFVGASSGRFYLFRNDGTPQSPLFVVASPPPPFDTLDLGADSAPRFGDIDGDGDLDVVVGARSGGEVANDTLHFWINDGGIYREDPAWPSISNLLNPVPMIESVQGKSYIFVGTRIGGILAFRDTLVTLSVAPSEPPQQEESYRLFPAIISHDNHHLVLRYTGARKGVMDEFVLVDLLGRVIWRQSVGGERGDLHIDIGPLPQGIYFWRAGGSAGVLKSEG